jgi:hypothetical protein
MSEEEPTIDPIVEKLHKIAKEWGYEERRTDVKDEAYKVPAETWAEAEPKEEKATEQEIKDPEGS